MQVSYSIAVAEPLSVFVDTYGTGVKSDAEILAIVKKAFDFRPGGFGIGGRAGRMRACLLAVRCRACTHAHMICACNAKARLCLHVRKGA